MQEDIHRQVFLESSIPGRRPRRGKVRDIYDFGDRLLMIATDRISAFDWVLPSGIPDKGRVLTQLSRMWFERLSVSNHLLTTDLDDVDLPDEVNRAQLQGRTMVVRKTDVVPIECVARGYLSGSGWKEYCRSGTICGIALPAGLQESDKLPEPIFTPATKAEEGHDLNIPFQEMCDIVGTETSEQLRNMTLATYQDAADYALARSVIIADTKFEFGRYDGELILIDEVLTPDSSRFWPRDRYEPGGPQPSYDKQFVRDWLESTDWDKESEPPELPDEIVEKTRAKYVEAYQQLVGQEFAW